MNDNSEPCPLCSQHREMQQEVLLKCSFCFKEIKSKNPKDVEKFPIQIVNKIHFMDMCSECFIKELNSGINRKSTTHIPYRRPLSGTSVQRYSLSRFSLEYSVDSFFDNQGFHALPFHWFGKRHLKFAVSYHEVGNGSWGTTVESYAPPLEWECNDDLYDWLYWDITANQYPKFIEEFKIYKQTKQEKK